MDTVSNRDTDDTPDHDIDSRNGWPDDLCVLLREHPRETWPQIRSPMARFWIDKHNYLRRQSDALVRAGNEYRESRSSPAEFGAWVAPRLQGFLAELHGHHQVEDFHYFPSFRTAEPRLASGFDVLASDHELLHEGILNIVEKINAFIMTLHDDAQGGIDAQRLAADQYIEAAMIMHGRLERHLHDEEDLIIPLMVARAE